MHVSAVIWDVHGTLVLRSVSEAAVALRALRAAGVSPLSLRAESVARARRFRVDANLSWRTPEEEAQGFLAAAEALLDGVDPAPTTAQVELVARTFAAYEDVYQPVPRMRELLGELAERQVRQAVVSNWPPSLRRFLRHHDLTRFFPLVVCSAEEGIVKPAPALFRRALDRLEISAGEGVYVGDNTELDIKPARALGMHAIHFDPGRSEEHADARTPAELRRMLFPLLGLVP